MSAGQYEIDHNISSPEPKPSNVHHRPDMSTFFSALETVETSDAHNANVYPQPENVVAVHRLAVNGYQDLARNSESNPLLDFMIEALMHNANGPPRELAGVSNAFLDELERVSKKSLKQTDVCPICLNPFLDDPNPLVVRLPCHNDHRFDMDCIAPWLKLNSTCPLDRKELVEKKEPPPKKEEDDDEEEYDDFYA